MDSLTMGLVVGQNVMLNVFVMFLLMAIGFVLAKKNILTSVGVKQLTDIVLIIVTPCVIINSYQRSFNPELIKNLGISLIFAVIIHAIYIIVAPMIFRPREDKKDRVSVYSAVYSNCGFMALPLIQSLYGDDGVFYAVAYITVFIILYWTHGIYVYSKDTKQLSVKKLITNPGILGTLIGITLFLLQIKIPVPVAKTVSFMAALNTPVPMIILGTYLVNFNLKKTFKNPSLWGVCLIRLLIFPILSIILAKIMNLTELISMTLVLSCSCPVAVVASLFATKYNLDSDYASQIVSVSTLLSILTIPFIMILAVIVL